MSEDVQDYNDVQGMVQHAMDQDFNKANQVFGDVMSLKIQDLLDQGWLISGGIASLNSKLYQTMVIGLK